MSVIGDYIRKKREENEMNITDLAKKAKISRPYLSQIESGTRNPSPEILRKLHKPLNLTHHELMYKADYISKEAYDLLSRKQELRERLDEIKIPAADESTQQLNRPKKNYDININDYGIIKKLDLAYEIKKERDNLINQENNTNIQNELSFLDDIEKEVVDSITELSNEKIDLYEVNSLNCDIYYKNKTLTNEQIRRVTEMLKIILE